MFKNETWWAFNRTVESSKVLIRAELDSDHGLISQLQSVVFIHCVLCKLLKISPGYINCLLLRWSSLSRLFFQLPLVFAV